MYVSLSPKPSRGMATFVLGKGRVLVIFSFDADILIDGGWMILG